MSKKMGRTHRGSAGCVAYASRRSGPSCCGPDPIMLGAPEKPVNTLEEDTALRPAPTPTGHPGAAPARRRAGSAASGSVW